MSPFAQADTAAGNMGPPLERCLDQALAGRHQALVFFRADDIGVPGAAFVRLIDLFCRHQTPLALAVVPAWLTAARWQALQRITGCGRHLWCWHQHGWRHANHEPHGKKQEFGPSRPDGAIDADLKKGREQLRRILGAHFTPVFTPPWNRCDTRTLNSLARSGFAAVSRFAGAAAPAPLPLATIDVHVDLHTGKRSADCSRWVSIIAELGHCLAKGLCGIMIHHRRMGEDDFVFLELLLAGLAQRRQVMRIGFGDLLARSNSRQ